MVFLNFSSNPTLAASMELKDYYSILELPPSASLHEIKKAYRRLAHQYHPDKNANDKYAATNFTLVKEAYEVLSNPSKKEHYLQLRWYYQGIGKKISDSKPVTPETVLKQCLELNRYVSRLDIHRMDKAGLSKYINEVLSDSVIEQLKAFKEPAINYQIILSILRTSEYLKAEQASATAEKLFSLAHDEKTKKLIIDAIRRHQQKERWQKYKVVILVIATAVICVLIYLGNR